jgi:hypothetical protein
VVHIVHLRTDFVAICVASVRRNASYAGLFSPPLYAMGDHVVIEDSDEMEFKSKFWIYQARNFVGSPEIDLNTINEGQLFDSSIQQRQKESPES